jgi:hypothetical protein
MVVGVRIKKEKKLTWIWLSIRGRRRATGATGMKLPKRKRKEKKKRKKKGKEEAGKRQSKKAKRTVGGDLNHGHEEPLFLFCLPWTFRLFFLPDPSPLHQPETFSFVHYQSRASSTPPYDARCAQCLDGHGPFALGRIDSCFCRLCVQPPSHSTPLPVTPFFSSGLVGWFSRLPRFSVLLHFDLIR